MAGNGAWVDSGGVQGEECSTPGQAVVLADEGALIQVIWIQQFGQLPSPAHSVMGKLG